MDELRKLANKRVAAIWPPQSPFDECDVVVCFRSKEDAEAFSRCLATGEPGTELFGLGTLAKLQSLGSGY